MKTIVEYAKQKGCSRQSIYSAINRNEIDYINKFGKRLISDTAKNRKWFPKHHGGNK